MRAITAAGSYRTSRRVGVAAIDLDEAGAVEVVVEMHDHAIRLDQHDAVCRRLVGRQRLDPGPEVERYLVVGAAHRRHRDAAPASAYGAVHVAVEEVADVVSLDHAREALGLAERDLVEPCHAHRKWRVMHEEIHGALARLVEARREPSEAGVAEAPAVDALVERVEEDEIALVATHHRLHEAVRIARRRRERRAERLAR